MLNPLELVRWSWLGTLECTSHQGRSSILGFVWFFLTGLFYTPSTFMLNFLLLRVCLIVFSQVLIRKTHTTLCFGCCFLSLAHSFHMQLLNCDNSITTVCWSQKAKTCHCNLSDSFYPITPTLTKTQHEYIYIQTKHNYYYSMLLHVTHIFSVILLQFYI